MSVLHTLLSVPASLCYCFLAVLALPRRPCPRDENRCLWSSVRERPQLTHAVRMNDVKYALVGGNWDTLPFSFRMHASVASKSAMRQRVQGELGGGRREGA